MKCITHDDRNAVANCAKCGVGICKVCESETLFRINNNAMCRRCNYATLIENIKKSKTYIRYSYIKVFVYSVVLLLGIIAGIIGHFKLSGIQQGAHLIANNVVTMLMVWGLATFVGYIRVLNQSNSSGNSSRNLYRALIWWSNPGASLLGSVIGFIIGYLISAVALPFLWITTILSIKNEKNIRTHNENILAKING